MEKSYAKSLKTWSKKWGDLIEKGEQSPINAAVLIVIEEFTTMFAQVQNWPLIPTIRVITAWAPPVVCDSHSMMISNIFLTHRHPLVLRANC